MAVTSPRARTNLLAPSDTLSAEQFAQLASLLAQLDQRAGIGCDAHRRRAPRLSLRTPLAATLLLHHTHPRVRIFSRNLSTSGIGFVSKRLFQRGEHFALPLAIPNRPARLLLAAVTFSRYLREGIYEAGAQFLDSVDADAKAPAIPEHWLVGRR